MEMNQDRLIIFLVVVIAISCIALLYAWMLYCSVKKEDPGSRKLKELSSFIHEGAMAFLKREYKIIILFIAAVAVILCSLGMIPSLQGIDGVGLNGAICFVVGTLCSGIAGFIGMKAATAANARVAEGARAKGMGKALHIAFNGGSVLGLCVVGFGLLGLAAMFLLFIVVLKDVRAAIPVVAGYSLGCYLLLCLPVSAEVFIRRLPMSVPIWLVKWKREFRKMTREIRLSLRIMSATTSVTLPEWVPICVNRM